MVHVDMRCAVALRCSSEVGHCASSAARPQHFAPPASRTRRPTSLYGLDQSHAFQRSQLKGDKRWVEDGRGQPTGIPAVCPGCGGAFFSGTMSGMLTGRLCGMCSERADRGRGGLEAFSGSLPEQRWRARLKPATHDLLAEGAAARRPRPTAAAAHRGDGASDRSDTGIGRPEAAGFGRHGSRSPAGRHYPEPKSRAAEQQRRRDTRRDDGDDSSRSRPPAQRAVARRPPPPLLSSSRATAASTASSLATGRSGSMPVHTARSRQQDRQPEAAMSLRSRPATTSGSCSNRARAQPEANAMAGASLRDERWAERKARRRRATMHQPDRD
eukprot:SAG22_NODE_1242_length_5026_cov_2.748731_3_plen_328_part_00